MNDDGVVRGCNFERCEIYAGQMLQDPGMETAVSERIWIMMGNKRITNTDDGYEGKMPVIIIIIFIVIIIIITRTWILRRPT